MPGASLMNQHIKASEMRRSVAMAEIVFRHRPQSAARNCRVGGFSSSKLRPESGSSIVTRAHGWKLLNVKRHLP